MRRNWKQILHKEICTGAAILLSAGMVLQPASVLAAEEETAAEQSVETEASEPGDPADEAENDTASSGDPEDTTSENTDETTSSDGEEETADTETSEEDDAETDGDTTAVSAPVYQTRDSSSGVEAPAAAELTDEDIDSDEDLSGDVEAASVGNYYAAESYAYFYSHLNTKQKRIYNAFLQCGDYHTRKVAVTFAQNDASDTNTATLAEVSMVYQAVIYDHPELFWYNFDSKQSFGYKAVKVDTDGDGKGDKSDTDHIYGVALWYQYDSEAAYQADQTAFNNAVSTYLSDIDTETMPPAEIALRIHDKLIHNVNYKYDGTKYPHTAYGALVKGEGVCDGYTLAYKYLLEQCGIHSTAAVGTATYSGERHMWNLVTLGGEWYETDCTWDDVSSESRQHKYYDLTTEEMLSDHTRETSTLSSMVDTTAATYFSYSNYMYMCGKDLGTKDPDENELQLMLGYDGNYYELGQMPEESQYSLIIANMGGDEAAPENASKIWSVSVNLGDSSAFTVASEWNSEDNAVVLSKNGSGTNSSVTVTVKFDNGATATLTGTIGLSGRLVRQNGVIKYQYADGTYAADTSLYLGGTWKDADSNGEISDAAGWIEENDGFHYIDQNGKNATGWRYIGGRWYDFDSNGVMRTGWQYLGWSGGRNWFYFDPSSGAMRSGWQRLKWSGGTHWFFFDGNGAMKTGWQYLGWSGGRNWFYFDPSSGAMRNGWQRLKWSGGTHWFFFDGNGAMKTGWQYLGWSGGRNWFYFNPSNGAMRTGWQYLGWSGGNNWFYFDPSNGAMRTGWQYLRWSGGRNWFYFNGSNGAMKTGWQYLGWSGGHNWFYFDGSNGAMKTGWQTLRWSGGTNRFYFNLSNGAMLTGRQTIGGVSYTFDSNGALQ